MLSRDEVAALEGWVAVAEGWSHAARGLVGAAATLATDSRDLADLLEDGPRIKRVGGDRVELCGELRLLAETVEDETSGLRDHMLAMAADLEQYRSLSG